MLIADNAGYKVFCEVKKLTHGENNNHVRFYSVFEHSRDPSYKQTQLEMFLTDEELANLKKALAL